MVPFVISPKKRGAFDSTVRWSGLVGIFCYFFFSNASFGQTLQIPSRPTVFPLQVVQTNGPLHPVAWGDNSSKQVEVPPNLTNVIQVDSSPCSSHNLALLSDGRVVAWGKTNNGQCQVPANLSNVVQVACGQYHSLALKSDGSVVSWGYGRNGLSSIPPGLGRVVQIDGGSYHSLALLSDGTVATWGDNSYGQCDTPVGLSNVVQISAGSYLNVALTADGRVSSWGKYSDSNSSLLPFTNPPGLTGVVQVSAGASHAIALKSDSTVIAWGDNSSHQCDVPPGLTNAVQIAAGGSHSLALTADGIVVAWGENGSSQCGTPSAITNAVQVAAGSLHSLALSTRIPQSIVFLNVPGYVNLSNTPSLKLTSPLAVCSIPDSKGRITNANTGLPVSLSLKTGPASLTNDTLSFNGVGTIELAALQPGNGLYLPAESGAKIVTTLPRSQTISFPSANSFPYSTSPVALSATASSGLPLNYDFANPSVAIFTNGKVFLKGVGSTSFTVSQAGTYTNTLTGDVSGYWLPVISAPQTLLVTKGSQTLTPFNPIGAQPAGTTLDVLNLTRSSAGLPVSFSVKSGPATLTGSLLTLSGAGTVILAANQLGNANYSPALEVTVSFPVLAPKSQSISFPPFPTNGIPYSDNGSFPLSAISDSGLPVDYSVTDETIATVSGGKLFFRGVGQTTVVASQSGNVSADPTADITQYWSAATPVTNSLLIVKGSQTVTFPALRPIPAGSSFDLSTLTNLAASSGLSLSFRVVSGNANITNGTVLQTFGNGTVVLAARQNGSDLYEPSPEVTNSIVVLKGQTLSSFGSIKDQIFKPKLSVSVKVPTADSHLPVQWDVLSGPAVRSGNNLTITGGGAVTLYADQPGNNFYAPAPRKTVTFTVNPAVQKLGKLTLKKVVFDPTKPILIPVPPASSGLPVTLSLSSNSLSLADLQQGTNSALLTLKGAGTVIVNSIQAGSSSYLPVTNSVPFVVSPAPQTITFPRISNVPLNAGSLTITSPSSSSGLFVTVAVKSGPARLGPVTNGVVTFTNKGTITLTADQPGNQNYLPAKQVQTTFTVQ